MTLPVNDLRLSMFEPGQVWWLDDPIRIGHVVERTKIEEVTASNPPRIELKDALVVEITIPTIAIKGFVTERQATMGQRILQGLYSPSEEEEDEISGPCWQEVWSERLVPRIEAMKGAGGAAVPNEAHMEPQVYCHEEIGTSTRQKSSTAKGRRITGKMVPGHLIPAGLFSSPIMEPARETLALEGLPWGKLRKLAKEQGVNTFGMGKDQVVAALLKQLTAAAV